MSNKIQNCIKVFKKIQIIEENSKFYKKKFKMSQKILNLPQIFFKYKKSLKQLQKSHKLATFNLIYFKIIKFYSLNFTL